MTLDEAIVHSEEKAKEHERKLKMYEGINEDRPLFREEEMACKLCAEEHRQLAEWLKELKQLREQTRWVPVSERLPKENGWYQCTIIANDLPRTMELFYKNGKWLDNRRVDMFNTYDIYGYGNTKEKHKLSFQELISEFKWSQAVIAWKPLSQPYKADEYKEGEKDD